jgi:hypothetical protein
MPPFQVQSCLVCEEARPELGGKWTLLGFFGVTPDVHVGIGDFSKPITLCFVFLGGPLAGRIRGACRVAAPSGANIPGGAEVEGEFSPDRPTSAFFLGFQNVVPGPGRYTIVFALNGRDIYESTFNLIQGVPAATPRQ